MAGVRAVTSAAVQEHHLVRQPEHARLIDLDVGGTDHGPPEGRLIRDEAGGALGR